MEMPIVGKLPGKYPAKYIIALGWLALAVGMYVSTVRLDTLISFQSAAVLRVIAIDRAGPSVRSCNNGGLYRDARRKSQ